MLHGTAACYFSSFLWPAGSPPAALASLLFNPSKPQNHWKNAVFCDFSTISHTCSFVLLSLTFSFWICFFLLFSSDFLLCFSSVQIVGKLTSKFPSRRKNQAFKLQYFTRFLNPNSIPTNEIFRYLLHFCLTRHLYHHVVAFDFGKKSKCDQTCLLQIVCSTLWSSLKLDPKPSKLPSTKRRRDLTPRSTRVPLATNSSTQHLV